MAIEDQLIASGLMHFLQRYDAPCATLEQLARVHTQQHIEAMHAAVPTEGLVHLDPDTVMSPTSLSAALRAAGAVVMAADLVLEGKSANAFCAVRPPGHHAESAHAMGFCLFNNIAVGAAHALEHHGLARVAIVDFDVHHGNGTEEIFRDNPNVMLCSTFQHPFYPHSGALMMWSLLLMAPLAAGADGEAFRTAVSEYWLPALQRVRPQMLFISAGFEAHREDDMAELKLAESDYAWVTQCMQEIADEYAHGCIVSSLEGGYALSALGRSATAHIKVLAGA